MTWSILTPRMGHEAEAMILNAPSRTAFGPSSKGFGLVYGPRTPLQPNEYSFPISELNIVYDLGANFASKESAPTAFLMEDISRLEAVTGGVSIGIASSPDNITYTTRSFVSSSTPVDFVESMHYHTFVPTGQFRYWRVRIIYAGSFSASDEYRRIWLCQPIALPKHPDQVRISPQIRAFDAGRSGYPWRSTIGGLAASLRGNIKWDTLTSSECDAIEAIFSFEHFIIYSSVNDPMLLGAQAVSCRLIGFEKRRAFRDKSLYELQVNFEIRGD